MEMITDKAITVDPSRFCAGSRKRVIQERYRPAVIQTDSYNAIKKYFSLLYDKRLLKYRFPDTFDPDVEHALTAAYNPNIRTIVVFDNCTGDIAAEYALSNFSGLSAMIHFSFHPDYHGVKAISVVEAAMYWLSRCHRQDGVTPYLKTLVGLTPVSNRLACRFLEKAKFKIKCVIPDAYFLSYLDRYDDGVLSIRTLQEVKNG